MAKSVNQQASPVRSVHAGTAFQPGGPTPEPEKALPSDPAPEFFSFTAADGQTFTSTKDVAEVVTPGLLRRYRQDEIEFAFQALEALFGDNPAAMQAIDTSWKTLGSVTRALQPFVERTLRVSLGE